jgi:hypothetical protein
MRSWVKKGLENLMRQANEYGVKTLGVPVLDAPAFEALVMGETVLHLIRIGYSVEGGAIDLMATNTLPYRRVTQGSQVGDRVSLKELVRWAVPIVVVQRGAEILSFFRQGSPILRGRDRPDLLVYSNGFSVNSNVHPLMGESVLVDWTGRERGRRTYSTLCDANGPVCRSQKGDLAIPQIGVEVSLNKVPKRLLEQLQVLSRARCRNIYAVLAHDLHIEPATLPTNAHLLQIKAKSSIQDAVSQFKYTEK